MLTDAMVVLTTVTVALSDLPPANARMTTLPAPIPVTSPVDETVATDGSVEVTVSGGAQKT